MTLTGNSLVDVICGFILLRGTSSSPFTARRDQKAIYQALNRRTATARKLLSPVGRRHPDPNMADTKENHPGLRSESMANEIPPAPSVASYEVNAVQVGEVLKAGANLVFLVEIPLFCGQN